MLDAVRERRPPFSPEDVVAEFAVLLKSYGISKVIGDKYAGEWPRERFSQCGVTYEPSAKPKIDLYRDLLPALNSRKVELLDDARLVAQLCGLERRTARGGRDSIDHAPGAHDDVGERGGWRCRRAEQPGRLRQFIELGRLADAGREEEARRAGRARAAQPFRPRQDRQHQLEREGAVRIGDSQFWIDAIPILIGVLVGVLIGS